MPPISGAMRGIIIKGNRKLAIILPILVIATIIINLNRGTSYKLDKRDEVDASLLSNRSFSFSRSDVEIERYFSSIYPANHPGANKGLRLVAQATSPPTAALDQCAPASLAKVKAKMALNKTQEKKSRSRNIFCTPAMTSKMKKEMNANAMRYPMSLKMGKRVLCES